MRPHGIVLVRNVLTLSGGRLHSLVSLGVFISTSPSRQLVHIVRHSVIRHKHATRVIVRHCLHMLGPVRLRFVRPAGHCTSLVVPRNKRGMGTIRVVRAYVVRRQLYRWASVGRSVQRVFRSVEILRRAKAGPIMHCHALRRVLMHSTGALAQGCPISFAGATAHLR